MATRGQSDSKARAVNKEQKRFEVKGIKKP